MAWQPTDLFPVSSIRPLPSLRVGSHKIIYCTQWELPGINRVFVDPCGILEYDFKTDTHTTIQSWSNIKYYGVGNVFIYSPI